MKVADFDYALPEKFIAQTPAEPRDASRLMVLDRAGGEDGHYHFRELGLFLRQGDLLVVNHTKVLPARLIGEKEGSQARIELLLLKRLGASRWETLLKPGKRLKPGQSVSFGGGLLKGTLTEVLPDGNRVVDFSYTGVFEELLERLGQTPLPPYITSELTERERYQTVYAKESGSAAAPTAGLHFTPELLAQLREQGVEMSEVLLHVGVGTFRPVKAERVEEHQMHSEYYRLTPEEAARVNQAKREGRRIVAVGTTVTRVLETLADESGQIRAGEGWTDIFIYPGYRFKAVDALITNFHFPRSSLLMLVSAFAGRERMLSAYQTAMKEEYRFYSFGDAMLIL
ncbi:MAG: tRNA preQ1(34) S-adenosylmethionine ribosyltransferase-isomerase QueA [Peptococcaceae bacterium]|nr:tRNA preQ1(34) S-adenosylmethionine ribosyltransferase-isomerase QueA [Peptococcaceae bacterium]